MRVQAAAITCLVVGCLQMATAFVAPSFTGAAVTQRATSSSRSNGASSLHMSRVCQMTGKKANRKARVVTFSHKRIHKVQHVNLQKKRLWWVEGNRMVKIRLSAKALRTVDKLGLDACAKKYGVDLTKYTSSTRVRGKSAAALLKLPYIPPRAEMNEQQLIQDDLERMEMRRQRGQEPQADPFAGMDEDDDEDDEENVEVAAEGEAEAEAEEVKDGAEEADFQA